MIAFWHATCAKASVSRLLGFGPQALKKNPKCKVPGIMKHLRRVAGRPLAGLEAGLEQVGAERGGGDGERGVVTTVGA